MIGLCAGEAAEHCGPLREATSVGNSQTRILGMTTRKCQNRPVWENPIGLLRLHIADEEAPLARKYQEVTTNITARASLTCKPRAKYWLSVSERSTVGSGGDQQETLIAKKRSSWQSNRVSCATFPSFYSGHERNSHESECY
jgi:hypothetical protein